MLKLAIEASLHDYLKHGNLDVCDSLRHISQTLDCELIVTTETMTFSVCPCETNEDIQKQIDTIREKELNAIQ